MQTFSAGFGLFECALSIVDKEIADASKPIGYGRFEIKGPFQEQIARDLKTFCACIKESDAKVSNPNEHEKNCRNSNNFGEPVTRL